MVIVGTNATKDMTISGYNVPKGTFVAVHLAKLHQDEREWPEPEKFQPERFLDSDGKFVGWSKLNGFLPFSIGRRECAGQSLAKSCYLPLPQYYCIVIRLSYPKERRSLLLKQLRPP